MKKLSKKYEISAVSLLKQKQEISHTQKYGVLFLNDSSVISFGQCFILTQLLCWNQSHYTYPRSMVRIAKPIHAPDIAICYSYNMGKSVHVTTNVCHLD